MKITFFFRKTYEDGFSIRNLFNTLIDELNNNLLQDGERCNRYELKNYNNNFLNIFKNIFDSKKKEGSINHITADVYSILFGFKNPTIITIHDCNPLIRYRKWDFRYWIYRILIFEIPMLIAKKVTVISEKSKRELLELTNCNPRKVIVIPNFIHDDFSFTKKIFNKEKPVLLQVGTRENKNIENLSKAIEGIDCHLRIIGQPSEAQILDFKNKKIDYSFAYNISLEQVVEEYKNCDLVTFVSLYEGFGLPLIEAQAIGRAIITSDIAPMNELDGGGAHLVDPSRPNAIRNGIVKLIEDKNYRELLIEKGLENVENYKLRHIAEQYYDLYKSVLYNNKKSLQLTSK